MNYTHIGARPYVGHYAVTADAYRKTGKAHALNPRPAGRPGEYIGLCGVRINEGASGDHFLPDCKPVPAGEGRVTCKRCRKLIA
jgi:hypothetical protein